MVGDIKSGNFIKMKNFKRTAINPHTIYSPAEFPKFSGGLCFFYWTPRIFATIRNISVIAGDSWIGFVFPVRVRGFDIGSFKIHFMNKNIFNL